MTGDYFSALSKAKKTNYELIYQKDDEAYQSVIAPMMESIYGHLRRDLVEGRRTSPIFTHHIDPISSSHYHRQTSYMDESIDQIVVDFIAGMTDDYFLDLYRYLFPKSDLSIEFKGYF